MSLGRVAQRRQRDRRRRRAGSRGPRGTCPSLDARPRGRGWSPRRRARRRGASRSRRRGATSRSSSTRRSFACSVERRARRSRRGRACRRRRARSRPARSRSRAGERAALVAEELALERASAGRRAQLTRDERPVARAGSRAWSARATSSLPVPVSPPMSTVHCARATRAMVEQRMHDGCHGVDAVEVSQAKIRGTFQSHETYVATLCHAHRLRKRVHGDFSLASTLHPSASDSLRVHGAHDGDGA